MNRTFFILTLGILSALLPASASGQTVSGTVNEDGFVVVSGTGVDLIGIDLQSPGGFLIPVPDAAQGQAAPFEVLVINTPNEILYGSIGINNAVTLDGDLVLSAGYDGGNSDIFDLVASWGGPLDGQEGPISLTAPSTPSIPEPSAGLLASVAFLSLLSLRVRRTS